MEKNNSILLESISLDGNNNSILLESISLDGNNNSQQICILQDN